jgi:hypothetical protein
VGKFRRRFGFWVLMSSGWIAGINLAAEILTRPSVDLSELLGRARYWEIMSVVPVGLGGAVIIGTLAKRWS